MANLLSCIWPKIDDRESATKYMQRAAGAAFVAAGLTTLAALLTLFNVIYIATPRVLVDAGIFVLVGFFVARGSTVAGVLALNFYLIEMIYGLMTGKLHTAGAMLLPVYLTLAFLHGVRGAFVLERLRDEQEPRLPTT